MTTIPRWNPPIETTPEEDRLLARLGRVRKLFGFLRRHRHELFDEEFQEELEEMYRDTGAGKDPIPPAVMAMGTILQGYMNVSDAEAVELTVMDRRWQLVLDCIGASDPAFSQGALQAFRERMIEHDMDVRLCDRVREFARETGEFDWKKLPKELRLAVDSAPFEGAGRVEDELNLLGHAARKIVEAFASVLKQPKDTIAQVAGIPVLNASSIKAGLDVDWTSKSAASLAINELVSQLDHLQAWVASRDDLEASTNDSVVLLEDIRAQNLETSAEEPGIVRIPQRVPKDRRISIADAEMRHGRKSARQRIDGYKRHIARDLDTGLIWACALTAANEPEADALDEINNHVQRQNRSIRELYIDRAYLSSDVVDELVQNEREVVCRPWSPTNRNNLFSKAAFEIDVDEMKITCPNGETMSFSRLGIEVEFPARACGSCPVRGRCTSRKHGRGRSVRIAEDEPLQQHLTRYTATPEGRAKHRERVSVEHGLAHLCARQGPRARYLGKRRNLYDVRRSAAIQNLETVQRALGEGYYRAAA